MKKEVVAIILIALFIGFCVGYAAGVYTTINWAVNKAVYFLDIKGYEIDMNTDEITKGLIQYKGHMDLLYPD